MTELEFAGAPAPYTIRKPGHYPDLTYEQYAETEGVRAGDLNRFDRTAAHARHAMAHPKDNPAMVLGRATHYALLEPDRFTERYVLQPDFNLRWTKGERAQQHGKPAAEAFRREIAAQGQVALAAQEWNYCLAMRDALYRHEVATRLLRGKGRNEGSIVWDDPETGLRCKSRYDRVIGHGWDPWHPETLQPAILDIKTSRDARLSRFSRDIWNFGYHVQAAHYIAGAEALDGVTRRWIWIVVENEPPHEVAVYDFDDTGLEFAEEIRRKRLDMIKQCQETDDWPGYPDAIQPINLPHWAFSKEA